MIRTSSMESLERVRKLSSEFTMTLLEMKQAWASSRLFADRPFLERPKSASQKLTPEKRRRRRRCSSQSVMVSTSWLLQFCSSLMKNAYILGNIVKILPLFYYWLLPIVSNSWAATTTVTAHTICYNFPEYHTHYFEFEIQIIEHKNLNICKLKLLQHSRISIEE